METLKALKDYFPAAVFTGQALVFISEDWRVELTQQPPSAGPRTGELPLIRLRISRRTMDGDFGRPLTEDFKLPTLGELAEEIEKYVIMATGANLRERV
ncbi:MAG: hypothetical protein QHH07_06545 [Sedimentisphaerales bacterium]|jgi:hypothetical protein|nr:hypothetical protein [Sedimentisphaerales bacterium]